MNPNCCVIARRDCINIVQVGSGGHTVERWPVNGGDIGSIPPTTVSNYGPHLPVFWKRH